MAAAQNTDDRGECAMPSTIERFPVVKHLYQNYMMDALRWNFFRPRADDIVVATTYKAGTTWVQTIVANLIFAGKKLPGAIHDISPWLDQRIFPLELMLTQLEKLTHRRSVKTHLPLDGLPFDQNFKYVYVGRDPRDVFMSFWNFYRNFSPQLLNIANGVPGRVGDELPRCPDDIHELWHNWITRGWFEWETEGYPFWSVMHHAQSWWDYRHLSNIMFIHYADLLADLEGGIRRIAHFLEINPQAEAWPTIVRNCSFAEMKARGEELVPLMNMMLKGGSDSFFHKGTNGRWQEVLSAEELKLYYSAAERELTPACRRWLENGGEV
jgi:aryl sulfotransferase